jgi:hypothetical protein
VRKGRPNAPITLFARVRGRGILRSSAKPSHRRMAGMAAQTTKIRSYVAGDALQIARLFYETVRSVNRADYPEEQVQAWAPRVPDPEAWHARTADRRTLMAEEDGEVVGFAEPEKDEHLDMLYVRKEAVGRGALFRSSTVRSSEKLGSG